MPQANKGASNDFVVIDKFFNMVDLWILLSRWLYVEGRVFPKACQGFSQLPQRLIWGYIKLATVTPINLSVKQVSKCLEIMT
jgi:hypothetical protein